jgi:hypothetical protein
MSKLSRIIKFFLDVKMLKVFYSMKYKGYLYDRGWIASYALARPVNKNGEPRPWVTHSFFDFIVPRLTSKLNIFEYGSGNSTLYYASKVNTVTSVESDEAWYRLIEKKMPQNVSLFYKPQNMLEQYIESCKVQAKHFDLIIVDGLSRYECAKASLQGLNDQGVVVLDNSNWSEHKKIYDLLSDNRFRFIDFWGVAPGSTKINCTTIFYRDSNCLGI